jgi:hypothetical protein
LPLIRLGAEACDSTKATDGENMALQISRTDAKLHIETTQSQLSITNQRARLELSHKEARVDIHSELPRVEIDQSECFATSGLMKPVDLTQQTGQRAMQQALTFTAKVAGDGDSMAAIENKSDPMPDIVERDAYPEHEFILDFIPKARPKITVVGGEVNINAQRNSEGVNNGVEGTYIPGSIKIQYTPSQVNIRMAQYPSIRMNYRHTGFSAFV